MPYEINLEDLEMRVGPSNYGSITNGKLQLVYEGRVIAEAEAPLLAHGDHAVITFKAPPL